MADQVGGQGVGWGSQQAHFSEGNNQAGQCSNSGIYGRPRNMSQVYKISMIFLENGSTSHFTLYPGCIFKKNTSQKSVENAISEALARGRIESMNP